MAAILAFMESPLVTWIQTFTQGGEVVDFQELSEGAFLNDVFFQIADREVDNSDQVKRAAKDSNARLHNWSLLLHNVINFYQEVLDQVVVFQLPDVLSIAKEPLKDSSLAEVQRVLLLLLGAAVQCLHKESYINAIKTLPIHVQEALVTQIQQVTDDPCTVLSLLSDTGSNAVMRGTWSAIAHSLSTERQKLHQQMVELYEECDYLRAEVEGRHGSLSAPESLDSYQMTRDLNICRNQLNKLTSELEEKQKMVVELRDDFDQAQIALKQVKNENLHLSKEAKLARSYRDEIDEYREEAEKVERYEKDLKKCQEKIRELEFYKTRVEELRQDNDSLMESRGRLEEQINSAQKRSESIMDELIQAQLQMEDLLQERDELRQRLQGVMDENSALESAHVKSSPLRRMISYASSDFLGGSNLQLSFNPPSQGGAISDELRDSMNSHVTNLEAENEQLRTDLSTANEKLAEAEREADRLRAESRAELQQRMSELELQTKELRKKTSRELSQEFESRVQEIEQRSRNLKERVANEFQQRLQQLEENNKGLQEACEASRLQLLQAQEQWGREREQAARTEKLNRDLVAEREQFKTRISSLQESAEGRVRVLQRQLDAAHSRSQELERQNTQLARLCTPQTPVASPATRGQHQPDMNSPARISYVPPSSPKQSSKRRPRSASQGEGPRPVALQRHASVIGIEQPQQRGKEFHHHHYHHHHYHTTPCQSAPCTPQKNPFSRQDRLRASVQPRPSQAFVRSDRTRASLPDRRPRAKSMILPSDVKRYPSNSSVDYLSDAAGSTCNGRNGTDSPRERSGRDSGCATSPDSCSASPENSQPGFSNHYMTGFEVFSTETVQMRVIAAHGADKWKAFMDKIVELQNRNQCLAVENAELKRSLKAVRASADRLDALESKNLKLEVENRKLRRICESLQMSLTGKNPYDKRLYHFYSNV